MHHRLDSLEKHVITEEVGKEFFSDALSTNLYMFATLIGFLGLFGWSYFHRVLRNHRRTLTATLNSRLEDQNRELSAKNERLNDLLKVNIYDVNRAMYKLVSAEKDDQHAFDWALSVAENVHSLDTNDTFGIIVWLETAFDHLERISVNNSNVIERLETSIETLDNLSQIDNEEVKNWVKKIRSRLYIIAFTPEQPPGDLMEGTASKPDAS
jgi:predicted negative regulator of RcsB-dependent stress response